jgi:hypothetical protein
MLQELWEQMMSDAAKVKEPKLTPFDPTKDHVYIDGEGDLKVMSRQASVRDHHAYDLETLARMAGEYSAVWYSRHAITLLCNDEDRRDRATLKLSPSKQIGVLTSLENGRAMSQRDLIFMLRSTFGDCLGPAGNLVELLRLVKFQIQETGESLVNRGKSSIGRQLSAELSAIDQLPERVTLNVPVFDKFLTRYRANVVCILEPDEKTQSFQLLPMPGTIEAATQDAEQLLGNELRMLLESYPERPEPPPVYYGVP